MTRFHLNISRELEYQEVYFPLSNLNSEANEVDIHMK